METWLIVWQGGPAPAAAAARALELGPGHPAAHVVAFDEAGGPRRALLLVHYAEDEMSVVEEFVAGTWEFGFVNRVQDVGEDGG